jgi:hypothetical protein
MKETKKEPTKYDALSIGDLEGKVEKMFTLSRESQREMYEVLEYLRTSGRFKENHRYKKTSFWDYLEDRFTIRQGTYRENVRAFLKFPEYAVEYGVGIVTKIDRVCGSKKIGKVLDEITKEAATRKKSINRAFIEAIIQKHRIAPAITKTITDWRAMYEAERAAHDATKVNLKIAVAKVKELQEQVEKLKETAGVLDRVRVFIDGHGMSHVEAPRAQA